MNINRIAKFIGSRWLFIALLGLFFIQAAHIAVTSNFPMPFDEQYHFTLIHFYAETSSPFIQSHPAALSQVGDATRMGSYLGHYLLSFPLKIVLLFTHNPTIQVIILRLINIAFVVGALALFRRFLLNFTKSKVASNGTLLIFCALPVTSVLAAQINYDNVLFAWFAGLLVLTQRIVSLASKHQAVSLRLLLTFVTVGLSACLIKFTFLPVAAVFLLLTSLYVINKKALPSFRLNLGAGINYKLVAAVLICVVSVGLFAERYVGNLVTYGSLQPDCSRVQTLKTCLKYGPWARNYEHKLAAVNDTTFEGRSIPGYVVNLWLPLMIKGLGFSLQGKSLVDPPKAVIYGFYALVGLTVAGIGAALIIRRSNPIIVMIVAASGLYMAALLQRNYSEFMSLHELVAVQGRYALPLLIPLFGVAFTGLKDSLRYAKYAKASAKDWIETVGSMQTRDAYVFSYSYWLNRFQRIDQPK